MTLRTRFSIFVFAAGLFAAGCTNRPETPDTVAPGGTPDAAVHTTPVDTTDARVFTGRGVVKNITPSKSFIVIDHELIPGYMNAMTMPYEIRDPAVVEGIIREDSVRFEVTVVGNDAFVSKVTPIR